MYCYAKGDTVKIATWDIEFVSHCLANSVGPNGKPDHFQRDSAGSLIFAASWWHSAFSAVIEMLRMRGIKAADIQVDLQVKAPTEVYSRRYGEDQFRSHEAIMPGSRVSFTAIVADNVTEQMLQTLLDRMGRSVGLSPYGFRLGYGRFNVIEAKVAPSDAA